MKKKIVLIFFVLFILFLPVLLRFMDNNLTLPGNDVYSYLTENVSGEQVSVVGRLISFIPFSLLMFFPLFSVLLSLFFIVLILSELKCSKRFIFVFVLIFSLSPLSQSMSFFVGSSNFAFPLFLAGLFFLLKKSFYPASFFLLIASLISFPHAVISFFTVFIVKKFYFEDRRLNFIAVLIVLLVFVFNFDFFVFNFSKIYPKQIFANFFSDFGSDFGFGLFGLFLASFGFAVVMKFRKKYFSLFLFSLFLFFCSLFFDVFRIYFLLIVVFLSSIFVCDLYERKWFLESLKNLVLLTIFCGLLFTSLSHAITLSSTGPSHKFAQGLIVLSKKEPGFVLTSDGYSDFVEFYSLKQSVSKELESSSALFSDYMNMFYSDNIVETLSLMDKYDVRYVVITPDMVSGGIWTKDDQGLVFLLEHSKHFKSIAENDDVRIWEVSYEKEI